MNKVVKPNVKVRGKRAEIGYSQTVMAKYLGISKNNYNKKENGKIEFKLDEIRKLLELFNCDFSDIF